MKHEKGEKEGKAVNKMIAKSEIDLKNSQAKNPEMVEFLTVKLLESEKTLEAQN